MIRRRSSLVTTVLAALTLTGSANLSPLEAQELPRSFASLRYAPTADTTVPHVPFQLGDSTPVAKTYWLEGGIIGGTVVGVLLANFVGWGCNNSDSGGDTGSCWDNILLAFVVGFGIGFTPGALLGGQLKKPGRDRQPGEGQMEPAAQDSTESSPP
jgi:hypothetical protein